LSVFCEVGAQAEEQQKQIETTRLRKFPFTISRLLRDIVYDQLSNCCEDNVEILPCVLCSTWEITLKILVFSGFFLKLFKNLKSKFNKRTEVPTFLGSANLSYLAHVHLKFVYVFTDV